MKGCLSVKQQESIPYSFWRKDLHLCVRRLTNYNFYSSLQDIANPQSHPTKLCSEGAAY